MSEEGGQVVGEARKTFSTKEAKDSKIKFEVSPKKGDPYNTEFTFNVEKDKNGEALMCKFSYENKVKKSKDSKTADTQVISRVTIDDESDLGATYTTEDQSIVTTLPEPSSGNSIVAHVKCEDALGEVRTGKKNIPLTKATGDAKKKGKSAKKNKIKEERERGKSPRTSDIVELNEASKGDRDADTDKEMARAIKSKGKMS